MARVLLVNPPSPEPVRTPLLSFCHLASSLRAGGHEVAILDGSAPFGPGRAEIVARAAALAPDLVGLHVKTLHAQPAWALAEELRPLGRPLVAGGPHPTVCPDEPFRFGCDFAIRGEGEHALVELAEVVDGRRRAEVVAGLSFRGPLGVRHNAERGFILDLDALPAPWDALDLFDPAWYGAQKTVAPAGLLSSRGCPAACTFCSNNVTGRRFRYRSADAVADEVRLLRDRHGMVGFNFYDDSFAVGRRRVEELCAALRRVGRVHWAATVHPAHLDRAILEEMKAAGCGGIDIGMESADPGTLLRIGKGVTVEQVMAVLAQCADVGLHVVVNLMFGWPDETEAELDATIDFMDRAAPLVGGLNARGVVVPYPGTEIYDRNHERFGFTEWWIREPPLEYPAFPTEWSEAEVKRCYAADPALDRNFFRHPEARVARIREALWKKADLTFAAIARHASQAAVARGVPAAGAR